MTRDEKNTLAEIVASHAVCMPPDTSVTAALRQMQAEHTRSIVVATKDKKPLGIVTEQDIIHLLISSHSTHTHLLSQAMSHPVHTIQADCSPSKAAQIMRKEKVKRLVVVDKANHITSITTLHDIVKSLDKKHISIPKIIHEQTKEEHLAHIQYLECMGQVDQVIRQAANPELSIKGILRSLLAIFDCDQTYLITPCNPHADSWSVSIEQTKPEYSILSTLDQTTPMTPDDSMVFQMALTSSNPIIIDANTEASLLSNKQFPIQSQILLAIHPWIGKPWLLGMNYCTNTCIWSKQEKQLFQDIGYRASDALNNLLLYRTIQTAKREWEESVDAVSDHIGICNMAGRILRTNKAMHEHFKLSHGELIGKNHSQLYFNTSVNTKQSPINIALTKGIQASSEQQLPNLKGWHSILAYPRFDAGKQVGAVFVIHDITKHKQAEEQIRKHQAELAHVTRLTTLGEMASGLAHELNQPLSAISSYSEAGKEIIRNQNGKIDDVLYILEQCNKQSQRAGKIIRGMRNFVRNKQSQKEELNINTLIKDVAVLIEPELGNRQINLQFKLDYSLPYLLADRIQIEQIVLNLMRNGIEAIKSNGTLTVHTFSKNKHIQVTVQDTGPGVSKTTLAYLFEPFFTTKTDGLGMGLSICHSIIKLHNGRLWAEPNSDSGAFFHFTLPMGKESANDKQH